MNSSTEKNKTAYECKKILELISVSNTTAAQKKELTLDLIFKMLGSGLVEIK